MPNHFFPTIAISVLIAIGSVFTFVKDQVAIAQTSSEPQQPTQLRTSTISVEKKALIKELLEITEASKNAQQIMDMMLRAELPKMLSTILKEAPYLDRPEAQKQLNEIISNMVAKYRDRVIAKIDVNQLIEEISYPVYDKYFTEAELGDIIGFYKSATGKKAIALMPQIINDSMHRSNEILLPKMSKLMAEIITEELATLLPKQK